ncbi:MAG TPA: GntR family transcriptional regulator [Solirubrobacterales bacterium]|nr:GntR family transcriptional regulator [Solirubrobacterales bacterium]
MTDSSPAPSDLLPRTRAEAVADELRRLIKSGELKPGTRLHQAEIAGRIGVSTTPVREAFMRLAREGLIRQDPHRGVMVFLPSLAELNENYEIRIALEQLATRLAATKLTDEDLATLDQLVREMRETDDPHHYLELNSAFHARIYAAADRPRLAELIENFRDTAAAYISLLENEDDPAYAKQVQKEHERIAAALRSRKAAAAAKAMGEHLGNSAKHIARSVEKSGRDGSVNS